LELIFKENDMKELAVGYCRVSTKKQEQQGLSLGAQEDYIRTWNENNGFDLVKVFKVQETGGGSERKHLVKTFDYCIINGISHILIADSDRWTRSREMDVEAQKFIKKHDLSVHILREQKVIGQYGSAAEKLSHNVKVDVDEFVRDSIREKVTAGLKRKLAKGEYTGSISLGYHSIRKTDKSSHKIIQDEKALKVKKLLEIFSTGKYSIGQLGRLAKDIGLTPKVKNKFQSKAMVKLIKNRFYYGEFEINNQIYKNKTQGFEPIITKKTWKKNQEILKHLQKYRKEMQRRENVFRFNHLMTCGKCGQAIFGEKFNSTIKYKTKKNGLTKKKYNYPARYHCTKGTYYISPKMSITRREAIVPTDYVDKRTLTVKCDVSDFDEDLNINRVWIKKGAKVKAIKCKMPAFREDEISEILKEALNLIKYKKDHWKKVKEVLFQDDTKEFLDFEIRNLREELTKSETSMIRLYEDYKNEIIDAEFFKKQSTEIRTRQNEIKDRLAELEEEREVYDVSIGKSIEILDSLKNWNEIVEKADENKRYELLKLLTIKISTAYEKSPGLNDTGMIKDLIITFSPEVQELFWLGLIEADKKLLRGQGLSIDSFNSNRLSYTLTSTTIKENIGKLIDALKFLADSSSMIELKKIFNE